MRASGEAEDEVHVESLLGRSDTAGLLDKSEGMTNSISVIIVSHNYGEFLSEAVESVLEQTRAPDAILIVDDFSTDGTGEIGKRYERLHPEWISYVKNESRLGIVKTFNRAVTLVETDLICFLGADNRLSPNYVESCLDYVRRGADVVYTDFRLFGKNAEKEFEKHPAERRGRVLDSGYYEVVFPEFKPGVMRQGNFIHGSAVYRKKAFDAVGGYLGRRPGRPEDANLFRRMVSAGYVACKASEAWLEYRQHSDHQANNVSRMQGDLQFYRAYSRRLEMKVRALEASFAVLSPVVRLLSQVEDLMFRLAIWFVRIWRRATR